MVAAGAVAVNASGEVAVADEIRVRVFTG